ncbi:MAG: zf-HC2 domain-containing protein [Burkholderiales bacterium]|nr:zf-HC2 domain-containing protein [Burkholderiales bacterium]
MTEPGTCPRMDGLSAYVDDALAPTERTALDAHLATCPVCGAALAELARLRQTFRDLPDEKLAFDLGAVVLGRLPAALRPVAPRPRRRLWQLAPVSLGAAAALATGLYLGALLSGAAGVVQPPRLAAMAVFDAVPPGAVCLGQPSCYGGAK